MDPRALTRWGLIACALVLAGWSYQERGKALGKAEVAEERADSLYRAAIDYEGAYRSVALQAGMAIRVAEESRDSAVARADRAARRRPTIVERVVLAAGPDSAVVRAAVEEVADSIDVHELAPLRLALAQADSIGEARARQLAASQALNAAFSSALEASRTEGRAWESAAKGGGWLATASKIVAAGVFGYAVGRAF